MQLEQTLADLKAKLNDEVMALKTKHAEMDAVVIALLADKDTQFQAAQARVCELSDAIADLKAKQDKRAFELIDQITDLKADYTMLKEERAAGCEQVQLQRSAEEEASLPKLFGDCIKAYRRSVEADQQSKVRGRRR